MSASTSPNTLQDGSRPVPAAGSKRRTLPGQGLARLSLLIGTLVVAVLYFWAAWQRRWISDDGLIVLRTVRNLLAGNGPVFNVGERVESNTSTVWTYLNFVPTWATGARPEYVVLTVTLVLTVLCAVFAMLGSATLLRGPIERAAQLNTGTVLLPAGVLAYIAIPPARDFATSGLETSLVLAWIAVLWWLLARWAVSPGPRMVSVLVLAFVAGMGPLVRPELAVMGALTLLLLLASLRGWRSWAAVVLVAGAVPVGYQIFRMGYYALPYPGTAVAKDAGGAKWEQGWRYLGDLNTPYLLWIPLALLAVAGLVVLFWRGGLRRREARAREDEAGATGFFDAPGDHSSEDAGRFDGLRRAARTPAAVVALILVNGLLLGTYVLRVGGDFMHGRTLLPVVFLLLLPVAVLPLSVPLRGRMSTGARSPSAGTRSVAAGLVAVLWLGVVAWSIAVAVSNDGSGIAEIGANGIVDERAFYQGKTGVERPLLAEDYLGFDRMESLQETLKTAPKGSVLLPTADPEYWAVVPPTTPDPPNTSVFFVNLGMSSMLTDLDVRVLDPVGLAYPLAAHTERIEGGRIGHDKHLHPDWLVADSGAALTYQEGLPFFLSEEWVQNAKLALTCPETQELLRSYRGPLGQRQFARNVLDAFRLAGYRIEVDPVEEIERCRLEPTDR